MTIDHRSNGVSREAAELSGDQDQSPDRLLLRLERAPDGRFRVDAVGPAGRAEATVAWPDLVPTASNGDPEPDPWAEARRIGARLHGAAFPSPIQRLLDESRHKVGEAPLPIVLELADPALAALPWELLRDPETERFLVLSPTTPLSRRLIGPEAIPATTPKGSLRASSELRVGVVAPVADEAAMAGALQVGADPRVQVALQPVGATAKTRPHVVQLDEGAAASGTVPPGTPLVVRVGDDSATPAPMGAGAVVTLPAAMPPEARTSFLIHLYAALAAGSPVDAAMTTARRTLADERSLLDLAWSQPVLAVAGTPAPLVGPRRRFARVGGQVRERTAGWVSDTLSGVVSSVAVFLLGLTLFRLGFSSSPEFEVDILSPFALFESFKALVLELSAFQEFFLLGAGASLLTLTVLVAVLWLRHRRDAAGEQARWHRRLSGAFVSLRAVSFLAVATLTVLGAYAYQQYLWNYGLKCPFGSLCVGLTREVAAASFKGELADALFNQGQARRVVVRELPVNFDARDTGQARTLGKRIGAEAVIIYRADEGDDGTTNYVAYVVFTDPKTGLTVGGEPAKVEDPAEGAPTVSQAATVRVREGVEVPALQTETLSELVNASSGIIAYDDDRAADAIARLELALPQDVDAPNTGVLNFYLGNAYTLDDQSAAASAAYERAAAFFERRQQAGDKLGPQDELLLVRAYRERGHIAAFADELDTALAWYEKAVGLREDLLARAGGLERPGEVHATYARLFTFMADAYRAQAKTEEQQFWHERATAEIDALAASADPNDTLALLEQSVARFFNGDCSGAVTDLERLLTLDPTETDALNDIGIIHQFQGRDDLAVEQWQQIIRLNPDAITARELVALNLTTRGLADGQFVEPAYLLQAEQQHRDILRLDPRDVDAHEELADLAEIRAGALQLDSTALFEDDALTVAKSSVLWQQDPARRQAALDLHDSEIEERRILATELQPGNPTRQAELASAYAGRQAVLESWLPDLPREDQEFRTAGEQILADAAQIYDWTDKVLAPDAPASRLDRLTAWAERLESRDREWSWYTFYAPDPERQAAVEKVYQEEVAAALALVEAEPIVALDEVAPARLIYNNAAFIHLTFAPDDAAAAEEQRQADDLTTRETTERRQRTRHTATFCTAEQDKEAGNTLLQEGDLAGARQQYEAALAANPSHVGALTNLAFALYLQGDIPGAIARTRTLTDMLPNDPLAWRNLGLYQLVAGDGSAATDAYGRFLETSADLPPQERLFHLRSAIADLHGLVDTRPELGPGVLAVVPLVGRALDGMGDDATATFQYPARYAQLGAVALDADNPAAAEPLLRRSLALDPHQPVAHADLVLTVAATGHDPTAATESAIAETRDLLWVRTIDVDADAVLASMETEAERYRERFPLRQTDVEGFLRAITAERARRDDPAHGVAGTSYTSPTFGYSLTWDAAWSEAEASAESGFDTLDLSSDGASVSFWARTSADASPEPCLAERVASSRNLTGVRDFGPKRDASRQPIAGVDGSRAFAVYTYTFAAGDGTPASYVQHVECRVLVPYESVVQITMITVPEDYAEQAEALERLLTGLRLPAAPTTPLVPAATPVAERTADSD